MTLLVMVPTRHRRENCERFLKSFEETADEADLVFITDPDDDSYEDMEWGKALHAMLEPRGSTAAKVNQTALAWADSYDALMFIGDDNTFVTPHWDTLLLKALNEQLGGSGFVYPENGRRRDIPECVVISSDIVNYLGYFMNPGFDHYYVDNVWSDLGRRACLIRYVPEVVVDHKHYQVNTDIERDQTYSEAEQLWGKSDYLAFQRWRANEMPIEVSRLRRRFNPDVKWVLGRF